MQLGPLVLLLPLSINLVLLVLFAHTLAGGRTTLVSRFARLARGRPLEPASVAYTRGVTRAWAAYFALMAAAYASPWLVPAWTNSILTLAGSQLPIVLALLTLEFLLRRRLLPEVDHVSARQYVDFLRRCDLRAVLRDEVDRDRE